jgi:hypothetical protein
MLLFGNGLIQFADMQHILHSAHCIPNFCWWNRKYSTFYAVFHTIFSVRNNTIHYSHPLMWHAGKNCMGSDLVNEVKIPCLLFWHQKHSLNNAQNCFWCMLLHCLAEKRHSSLVITKCVQKWCQNVCYTCIILFTLIAQHTPTTSRNGTLAH